MCLTKCLLTVATIFCLVSSSSARAGQYDVCVTALDGFTFPVNEYNCWDTWLIGFPLYIPNPQCAVAPHCCTPQVCKLTPDCGIAKVVYKSVAAGEMHCFEGVTPSELFDRWTKKQFALTADLLTGGLLSELYPIVLDNINTVALSGNHLPTHVQNLVNEIIAPVYDGGRTGFTHADVANIKIVNESKNALTGFWLPDSAGAITLGPVIVMKDEYYNQLMDASNAVDLYGLLMGQKSERFSAAVTLLLHELVHVKQYANLGRETFTTNYLLKNTPLVTNGYGFCEFEQEAYKFQSFIAELLGGKFCYDVKPTIDNQNSYFLKKQPISCNPVKDSDSDHRFDHLDNCPFTANPDQLDNDQNRLGDLCDWHVWLPVVVSR